MILGPVERGVTAGLQRQIALGKLTADPAQLHAARELDDLAARLAQSHPRFSVLGVARNRRPMPAQMQGLYLHGPAGRGKSMLMDAFHNSLSLPRRRVHFHALMQELHSAITKARAAGAEDPVQLAADGVGKGLALLCLDELDITEIVDAMLVGRVFDRLFERGIVVVATSNRHPDDLFKEGWNRGPFLPFIARIKDRLRVVPLFGAEDYRRTGAAAEAAYICPLGPEADRQIDDIWSSLAPAPEGELAFSVHGRSLRFERFASGALRASFEQLCGQPFGPAEYLALARAVKLLVLEGVPVLSPKRSNEARRFVMLIDALYEARARLILSAAAQPDALYPEGAGAFEFARTASRLAQMRSQDWWAQNPSALDARKRNADPLVPFFT